MRKIQDEYLRSSLFGFEDALVSTTGMVVGISIGTSNLKFILLAAFVTIAVEAVSMGAGEFLSDEAVHELDRKLGKDNTLISATVMFTSYILGGLIPVLPIILLPALQGIIGSITAAFIGLFVLGFIKGKIVNVNRIRSAVEMLTIGGIATVIGIVVGFILKI
ncbi:VIT1/CCC1 transporter family protein [Candidatus Daviesbacteria bacterium]|nr:VIT1/CCC1 transporter family protein [Candidatus Daviesbacteria bacterium]